MTLSKEENALITISININFLYNEIYVVEEIICFTNNYTFSLKENIFLNNFNYTFFLRFTNLINF